MGDVKVCPAAELPAGSIKGIGRWAVGNTGDEYFAVTRYCHHLCADLAKGSIDRQVSWYAPGTAPATTSTPAEWSEARRASS
jgi:hypothetical protein